MHRSERFAAWASTWTGRHECGSGPRHAGVPQGAAAVTGETEGLVAQCSAHAPSSVASAIIDSETKQQSPDEDGRERTDPKAVAGAPSSARDTAFASQYTSRKSSAHGPRSETRIQQRPRVIGPRRKIRLADLGLDGVTQTILGRGPEFGEPTSNGMQAALATVFGLPLDAVPHFPDTEPNAGWWDRMNAWLAEHYGVVLVSCTAGTWEVPRVLHLTQGNTVRDVPHVVVAFGGQLLHDPHPSRAGLSTVLSHELFLAVHPSGVDALRCVPVSDALEVGQSAYPLRIPELALRTTLAPSGVKRCTRCGVVKALGEFPRVPGRQRVSSWCKPCSYRSVKAGNERLRLEVLAHYSGGTMRCACCGQDKVPFLALDHIEGNGATDREEIGGGASFYRWLKQNRFPPGLSLAETCFASTSGRSSRRPLFPPDGWRRSRRCDPRPETVRGSGHSTHTASSRRCNALTPRAAAAHCLPSHCGTNTACTRTTCVGAAGPSGIRQGLSPPHTGCSASHHSGPVSSEGPAPECAAGMRTAPPRARRSQEHTSGYPRHWGEPPERVRATARWRARLGSGADRAKADHQRRRRRAERRAWCFPG